MLSATQQYLTLRPDYDDSAEDGEEGPSWGLIIPIIMIAVFLAGVVLCLWWHKWRGHRTLHIQKDIRCSTFHRSYIGGHSRRSQHDVRDSTRSTAPLRRSTSKKVTNNNNSVTKLNNVNVIPVHPHRYNDGSFTFHWDKNHLSGYPIGTPPNPILTASVDRSHKKLSPIDELDSPCSVQISELAHDYVINSQAPFSPYHLTWATPSNAGDNEKSGSKMAHANHMLVSHISSTGISGCIPHGYERTNSPFFPNNNTPTTECDTESEASRDQYLRGPSSQVSSYPSTARSDETNLSMSTSTETGTTCRTSYTNSNQDTFQTSSERSVLNPSSFYPSRDTSNTITSTCTNYSSLPSSIAHFSKQCIIEDSNNNSMLVQDVYLAFPSTKPLNYTLASSLESSESHVSDNTSMIPNVGSSNTSSFPTITINSRPQSMEPSGQTSPEDLSKIVDEMSSIRPNSSMDPSSRIASTSGHSVGVSGDSTGVSGQSGTIGDYVSGDQTVSSGRPGCWSVVQTVRRDSAGSINNVSQEGSLYWDNYPLQTSKTEVSFSELDDSLVRHAQRYVCHIPVLMDTQFWV